ncbi:hypothetical protein FRC20_001481, partial [Serendipita sp. 405]
MESMKRKHDSQVEDSHAIKRRREELPECYRRIRNIPELMMRDARLDKGHFVGTLHAIEKETDGATSLLVSDGTDKILVCQFNSSGELHHRAKSGLGKEIKVALTKPFRQPLISQRRNLYPHRLVFQAYCFILNGIRFEDRLAELEESNYLEPETPDSIQKTTHSVRGSEHHNFQIDKNQKPKSTRAYQRVSTHFEGLQVLTDDQPKSWTSISDAMNAPPGTTLTIAGIVKDISPLHQFNSGDFCAEYKIQDETCVESQYLEVKLFAATDRYLPPLDMSDIGTVLLVSKVRITASAKASYLHARGNKSIYRYCCFSGTSDEPFVHRAEGTNYDEYQNLPVYRANDEEKEGMRRLLRWARGELRPDEQMPKPLGRREALHRLIEEINHGTSFDGTFELLSVSSDAWNAYAHVTDYTQNNRLQEPGSTSWWYPKGQRTLKLKFFDSLEVQARALETGFIYRIKNIRIKFEDGALIGYCGERGGEIRQVRPEDTFYQNLKARKRCLALEEPGANVGGASDDEGGANSTRNGSPRKYPSHSSIPIRSNAELNPTEKSKSVSPSTSGKPLVPSPTKNQVSDDLPPPPKIYPPFPTFTGNIELSDIVECVSPDSHQLLSLQEIENMPQCLVVFRFRARIVDINPCKVNQAIIPYCLLCESGDFIEEKCVSCQSSNGLEYRVRLELVFQDSTGELSMRVDDDYATKFFRLPQRPTNDRASLARKLLRRFDLLMGTTSVEGEELVGG